MKHFLRAVAAVSASAMMLSICTLFPAKAADMCKVDTGKTYQNIRGFGGMNHPEWTGKDLTSDQLQTAFGTGEGELGLTVLRIFINPNSNNWNLAVPTAKYASQHGATVFATPWEPPANLAESGNGKGGKLHLPKANYGAYAEHLNNFGNYMKSQGVDLYSISVQNEPDYAKEWTVWSTDETTDFLANYGDKITSAKVMSPESFQYAPENASWVPDGGKKYYTKILNNQKAFANCDLFGTHFYGTDRSWMDFPALENCGKEIWMTEVYVPNSDADSANRFPEALDVSENIHNGLVVGNMSAYVWWYIRRSYGLMTEDGKASKRGYCMAQYSKFVRPGSVRIDATEIPEKDVYVSAYKTPTNQIVIVALNKSDNGYAQQFSLSKGEAITDVDRWRTSANENLAKTDNLEYTGSSFFAQLPAKSVSTFVISTDGTSSEPIEQPTETQPATEAQPDANGYYFHDTFEDGVSDWKGHGSSDVSLSGRLPYAGSEAMIVQNRERTWNGAEKALDSNIFKAGNTYSFSANVLCLDSDKSSETFALTLQYTGTDGETHFASVARAETATGNWVQLANQNFQIPEGATNCILYAETADTTSNFYLDEVIGAKAGTVINGPAPVTPTEATEAPTEAPTQPTEASTEPTEAPTQPTEAPTEPTEAPTQPTEAPTEPTQQPTTEQQTEPPTQPTEQPTQQPTTEQQTEPPTQPTQQQTEIKYGDANQDGSIDILDVITINKAILGKEVLNEQQNKNADVNRNGKPDSGDSLSILKYIVGLITSLPV